MNSVTPLPKIVKKSASDYLTKPFYNLVDDPNFSSRTQEAKVFVGMTGQGKTYLTATEFVPYLFNKHDMNLVIYTYPLTEIKDDKDWVKAQRECGAQIVTNPIDAIKYLKNGAKVIFLTTHQSFVVADKGKQLIKHLENTSKNFAILVDEAHSWMVSDVSNYKKTTGHNPPAYEAVLFKTLEKLSVKTPYIFGLTATPNREAKGSVPPYGDMKVKIINEFPPKELLINTSAWLSRVDFYDPNDLNASWDMWDKIEQHIIKLYTDYLNTGIKKTMMVAVGNDDAATGLNTDYVKRRILNIININALDEKSARTVAVMTCNNKETGTYSFTRPNAGTDDDENEIKEKLINQDDPLRIVIVKQKGRMGMNISTLGSLIFLRPTNNKDNVGAFTESPIQLMGRLVRFNAGIEKEDFTDKYGYDLTDYVKTLNEKDREKLSIGNSIDMLLPKTEQWMEAHEIFTKIYVSSVQQAKVWMRSL
tara:strand:- start:463 stop:1890 length:1428 start_codon:yes stop_codon:yes gene_type:complete